MPYSKVQNAHLGTKNVIVNVELVTLCLSRKMRFFGKDFREIFVKVVRLPARDKIQRP